MKSGFKVTLVTALVCMVAACGGGSAEVTTTTTRPDTTTTTTPETTPTSPAEDASATPSAMCLQSTQAMAAALASHGQAITGGSTDFEQATEQLHAMADAAPPEISGDFHVMAEELGKLYRIWNDINFTPGQTPTPEQIAALEAAMEAVDEDRLDEAADNIEAWLQEHCR